MTTWLASRCTTANRAVRARRPCHGPSCRTTASLCTALNVAFGRPLPQIAEPLAIDPVRLIANVVRRFQIEDLNNGDLVA